MKLGVREVTNSNSFISQVMTMLMLLLFKLWVVWFIHLTLVLVVVWFSLIPEEFAMTFNRRSGEQGAALVMIVCRCWSNRNFSQSE